MHGPKKLYDTFYPSILAKNLPKSLIDCLTSSLDEDPSQRTSFQALYEALASDTENFEDNEDLKELSMWEEELEEDY
jgi:Ca2+-binding EF-hand superfamily protein